MPQKAFEGGMFHVRADAFSLRCPKIEHIHFRIFSRFQIDHVFFL